MRRTLTTLIAMLALTVAGLTPAAAGTVTAADGLAPDAMRLACRGGDGPVRVECRWSEVRDRDFAGYVLLRARGNERPQVVFRTDDRGTTRYADLDVHYGTTYVYAVRAVARDGSIIAASRRVRAATPVAYLRLGCGASSRPLHVTCQWSPLQHPDFGAYVVYRAAEGERPHVVHRTDDPRLNFHRDGDVRPSSTYVYYVQAVATDGRVLGATPRREVTTPPWS